MLNTLNKANTAINIQSSISELLDPDIGILQEIKEVPRYVSDPAFFHYAGRACNALPFSGQQSFYNTGGASISREIAIYKAIGEAIERYSSAIYDLASLPLYAYESAPFECAHPKEFSLYSPAQYEQDSFLFVPFETDTPVRWSKSVNLITGNKVYIPAASVYMPYNYILGDGDSPVLQPISTGLACHKSHVDAAISAICEIIERDAVMCMWQMMLAFPQIRIETLSDINYDIVKRLEANGSRLYMFNLTMDHGVPTILSVLSAEGNTALPRFVFSAAADPDPELAVRKSLEEVPHTRRYCTRIMEYMPTFTTDFPEHHNVKDQEHHLHFYCDHQNEKYASFVFNNPKRISFDDLVSLTTASKADTLKKVIEAVKKTGENIYLQDLTTSDVAKFGFTVLRAVIPGYQRLCMGYSNRCMGGTRLYEAYKKVDCKSYLPEGFLDNPAPHPYP